jgi:hypothetical protein
MKKIFTLITPETIGGLAKAKTPVRLDGSVVDPLPLPRPLQTTIVGDLVTKMDRTYRNYLDRKHHLTATIADTTEQLRQTEAAILAIEAAMTTLADEVALTPDERKAAKNAADSRFDAAVERELSHGK